MSPEPFTVLLTGVFVQTYQKTVKFFHLDHKQKLVKRRLVGSNAAQGDSLNLGGGGYCYADASAY